MKKKKIIGLIILVICLTFVGRVIYFEVLKKQFISNLETALYQTNSQIIVLKELTPFEWDELYWGYNDSYGVAAASIGNIWKFYHKDQIIAEINLSSKSPQILLHEKCLCSSTAEFSEICFTPSTAIFEIIANNKYGIINLRSTICRD
jgi:hypothetical protein